MGNIFGRTVHQPEQIEQKSKLDQHVDTSRVISDAYQLYLDTLRDTIGASRAVVEDVVNIILDYASIGSRSQFFEYIVSGSGVWSGLETDIKVDPRCAAARHPRFICKLSIWRLHLDQMQIMVSMQRNHHTDGQGYKLLTSKDMESYFDESRLRDLVLSMARISANNYNHLNCLPPQSGIQWPDIEDRATSATTRLVACFEQKSKHFLLYGDKAL